MTTLRQILAMGAMGDRHTKVRVQRERNDGFLEFIFGEKTFGQLIDLHGGHWAMDWYVRSFWTLHGTYQDDKGKLHYEDAVIYIRIQKEEPEWQK